jgi:hypothetical protein
MKTYKVIVATAAMFVLSLKGAMPAYADAASAQKLASWAVGKPYSQASADRNCTSAADQVNDGNGLPGAPPGPPATTGYCAHYDCSSFVTYVLRQAGATVSWPKSTYDYWGPDGRKKGPKDLLANGVSPGGWKPCSGEPVCVGFTGWGEDGGDIKGPGHMVVRINGTVYSASGGQPWGDGVISNYPVGKQGEVLWFVAP